MTGKPYRNWAGLILAVFMVLGSGWAVAQEAQFEIKPEALAPFQRPVVNFNHEKHAENIECATCHHSPDQYGNHGDTGGGNCSDCHSKEATTDNPVPLELAFHQGCKGCHQKLIDQGQPSGPVMCGSCHTLR